MTRSLNFISFSIECSSLWKDEWITELYLDRGWMSVITGSFSRSPFFSESSRFVLMNSTSLVFSSFLSTFFSFFTRDRIESLVRPRYAFRKSAVTPPYPGAPTAACARCSSSARPTCPSST